MGIRGLFSYVRDHVASSLEWHKLHDCIAILDGNNVSYELHDRGSGLNAAFGGDYDRYASHVEHFLKKLLECGIQPIVVMDGGHEKGSYKLQRSLDRLMDQVHAAIRVDPQNQYSLKLMPPLGRTVFVDVAKQMGVLVLQSDFEADCDIAAMAKHLDAVILSNDSDFFIYDATFVPFDSINFGHVSTEIVADGEVFKYMPCYRFNADIFAKETKLPRSLFPVFGTIVPNDYITYNFLENFYSSLPKVSRKRHSPHQSFLSSIMKWLSEQESLDPLTVIDKVLSYYSSKDGKKDKLKTVLSFYLNTNSNLMACISHSASCPHNISVATSQGIIKKGTVSRVQESCGKAGQPVLAVEQEENSGSEAGKIQNGEVTKNKLKTWVPTKVCECHKNLPTVMHSLIHHPLPGWFVRAYRERSISHEVASILTKGSLISVAHVEIQQLPSVYRTVENILENIISLLWQGLLHSPVFNNNSTDITDDSISVTSFASEESEGVSTQEFASAVPYDGSDLASSQDPSSEFVKGITYSSSKGECLSKAESQVGAHSSNVETADFQEACDVFTDGTVMGKGFSLFESGTQTSGNSSDLKATVSSLDTGQLRHTVQLTSDVKHSDLPSVIWYIRRSNQVYKKYVKPGDISNIPTLQQLEHMSFSERRKIFYMMLELKGFDGDFPLHIEFIMVMLSYWFQNSFIGVPEIYMVAVLICFLTFGVIFEKYGRLRTQLASSDISVIRNNVKQLQFENAHSSVSVKDLLEGLTIDECMLACHNLSQYHHKDEKVTSGNFNRRCVHTYSEFQACIYFLRLMNSLLLYPFPSVSINKIWNGTFCYNITSVLSRRKVTNEFLKEVFGNNTTLHHLFLKIYGSLTDHLGISSKASLTSFQIASKNLRKKNNKRKKKENKRPLKKLKGDISTEKVNSEAEDAESEEEVDLSVLKGNRFSVLAVCSDTKE